MQHALLYLLAIASGLLNPVQSGLTTSLEKALERPFLVAAISLGLSLAYALLGALLVGQLGVPTSRAASVPWWAWLAGLTGFCILIARPYAAPALGAATFTGLERTARRLGRLCPYSGAEVSMAGPYSRSFRIPGAGKMRCRAAMIT